MAKSLGGALAADMLGQRLASRSGRRGRPPFHHGLSASVEFYSVQPGQEWDHAIRDGQVILFASPQLAGTRLYLYGRFG